MAGDVHFSCQCGSVSGALRQAGPRNGDHIVCHCADCQKFVSFLGAEDRIFSTYRGTALFQGRCAAMHLVSGTEALECVHLTEKPTLRWYAACCRVPMFNTYANGRVPYISTLLANCRVEEIDRHIGPAMGHLSLPDEAQVNADLVPMSFGNLMRRFSVRMIKDTVSGDRRRSALFDPATLEPICRPSCSQ